MISKERLEELIKQEAIVFDIDSDEIYLKKEDHICNYPAKVYVFSNYLAGLYGLEEFYETKEEAEWVSKNYCEKTVKFEPPTFEEFEKTAVKYGNQRNGWSWGEGVICEKSDCIVVSSDFGYREFSIENNKETKKQAYYKAVEYAKKLFLGEE